jgi:hypothetical protein
VALYRTEMENETPSSIAAKFETHATEIVALTKARFANEYRPTEGYDNLRASSKLRKGTWMFLESSGASAEELRTRLIRFLGWSEELSTWLWLGTPAQDTAIEGNPPTYVLSEPEVLRGRGGQLDGPHVGAHILVQHDDTHIGAVVTAH